MGDCMAKKYERVLLKLSGAAFKANGLNICPQTIEGYANQIKKLNDEGMQISIVIGGGNIWRGVSGSEMGMDRGQGDYMGMLATVMNSLALESTLRKIGCNAVVQSAIEMPKVTESFVKRRAVKHLESNKVVIFGGGTGSPYFTTDTAAALRASEINADVLLVAKNGVDGVYDSDPNKNPDAKKLEKLTHKEAIDKDLKIMDLTSMTLCRENLIDLVIFNIDEENAIYKAAKGQISCSVVSTEDK